MGRKDAMEPGFTAAQIDAHRPHPARMYDAFLGGKDNHSVDRDGVHQALRAAPETVDSARANRASLQGRCASWPWGAGIRQIIDIGVGIPKVGNIHEVADQAAPGTCMVYADSDPIERASANALADGGLRR